MMKHPQRELYPWRGSKWSLWRILLLTVGNGLLVLFLVSCSSQLYWVKQGAEPGDFDRDMLDCRRSLATRPGGGMLDPTIGIPQSEVELCLSKKGWFLAEKPADVQPVGPPN